MNLLKINEVSKKLNCSDSFVRRLISDGRLPFCRLGKGQGGLRVSEEQLREYLDSVEQVGEQNSPPAPKAPPLKHLTI